MKVFIDGKEVEVRNDVTVVYEGVAFNVDDDETGDLHCKFTHEGLILDVVDPELEVNDILATASLETDDLVRMCQ